MADQTSHDQLFKEVLGEFFPEFMELFFPQVSEFLDRDSVEFLPVELFTDLLEGDTFETDVIVKARFRGEESCFIVHVEHQGEFKAGFDRRMFNYFSLLHRDYGLPVYPIVIFSHRSPRAVGDRSYSVSFPDWEVLRFNYRVIRLNHLPWRDFVGRGNPVASAFMAKMKVGKGERLAAKLECLRGLMGLRLNPAQLHLLLGFVDTYLRLEEGEAALLAEQVAKIEGKQKEGVMQIVTSWEQRGIELGIEKGVEREGVARQVRLGTLLVKQLGKRLGKVSVRLEKAVMGLLFEQMEELGLALFDFEGVEDLRVWLKEKGVEVEKAR
jgi:hypothetical protein